MHHRRRAAQHQLRPTAKMNQPPMASNGFAGVWQLNLAQSNIPPVTKSQVATIETDGVFVAIRAETVNNKGERFVISFEGKFDGLDYPVTGTPFADTVSYRLLSPHVIEGISKKNGRICVKETAVLSDSGTRIRVTYLSFDAHGNTFENLAILEKVQKRKQRT